MKSPLANPVIEMLTLSGVADPRLLDALNEMPETVAKVTRHLWERHGIPHYDTADMIMREWNTSPQVAMIRMRYRLVQAERPPVNIEVL